MSSGTERETAALVMHPWSGETSDGRHLGGGQHVVEHGNTRVHVDDLLLHGLYVEHRMMPHVATTQLTLARNFLHATLPASATPRPHV